MERGAATELDAPPQTLDPGLDSGLERQAALSRWRRLADALITRTNRPAVTGLIVLTGKEK